MKTLLILAKLQPSTRCKAFGLKESRKKWMEGNDIFFPYFEGYNSKMNEIVKSIPLQFYKKTNAKNIKQFTSKILHTDMKNEYDL